MQMSTCEQLTINEVAITAIGLLPQHLDGGDPTDVSLRKLFLGSPRERIRAVEELAKQFESQRDQSKLLAKTQGNQAHFLRLCARKLKLEAKKRKEQLASRVV